jgi:hypothetical protein
VLGFEEIRSERKLFRAEQPPSSSDDQQQSRTNAEYNGSHLASAAPSVIATTVHVKRPRAPSDPFLDTPPMSRSMASAGTHSSGGTSNADHTANEEPPSPATLVSDADASHFAAVQEAEGSTSRIWIIPDLTNPEFKHLLQSFPSYVTGKKLPRFPTARPDADLDSEASVAEAIEVHFGTGTIQLSPSERRGGWEGGWWSRFCAWLGSLFG